MFLTMIVKIEQIEQVADGRHVLRDVGMVSIVLVAVPSIIVLNRIGQVVATAVAERCIEHPIPFNKLHERRMLAIDVADMAACRERRNGDHRNARTGPKEINWLDEARVVEASALIHGDEDGGLSP